MQPHFYFEDDIQAQEQTHIFAKCWNFVGFSEQVANPGQFITAEIAGTSVVVQNFKGELRALHNVCTHRFAKIQQEKCGTRALTCPYHGWTFDKDGTPYIPGNSTYFQLDDEGRKARSLRNFSLEICGRFMFVRLAEDGPNLQEYLGPYANILQHLSDVFTQKIDDDRSPWQANWKLGVESVLEVYHVASVHPESFNHFVRPRWEIHTHDNLNNGTAYLADNSAKWWDGVRKRLQLKSSNKFANYDHFLIFPNLAVAVSHGCLMSVQTYVPTSAETHELHYRIFMADSALEEGKQAAVRKAVIENVTSFNRLILSEDQQIMEEVQKGTRQMAIAALHGSNEARIKVFHRHWEKWMEKAPCQASTRPQIHG